jgi:hypothetical protein
MITILTILGLWAVAAGAILLVLALGRLDERLEVVQALLERIHGDEGDGPPVVLEFPTVIDFDDIRRMQ